MSQMRGILCKRTNARSKAPLVACVSKTRCVIWPWMSNQKRQRRVAYLDQIICDAQSAHHLHTLAQVRVPQFVRTRERFDRALKDNKPRLCIAFKKTASIQVGALGSTVANI
jgi:hypothetical protein